MPDPDNPIQLKKEQTDIPRFSHPVEVDVRKPQVKPSNPVVDIENATFYRRQPSPPASEDGEENLLNKPLFPGLNFAHPSSKDEGQFWAVVGPSNSGKTTFLEILRGQHLCFPPRARSYPYLSSDAILQKDHRLSYPARAIQYVGFDNRQRGLSGVGAHIGARYESRREATDFSVYDFLTGNTVLNAAKESEQNFDESLLNKVLEELKLSNLVHMPVANLSNGQSRRARIAKALLQKPELLLLDEPFSKICSMMWCVCKLINHCSGT